MPYIQLYTNDNYYNTPAITHELKNNGYETKIVLCTGPRLFNCGKFYGYAGFDSTEFNFEEAALGLSIPEEFKKGGNISEEHIVDEIIREFDAKEPGKKEFYMVLTMQTHSPYKLGKYENYDVEVVSSPASESMNDSLQAYAQGIFDTDAQLLRLYEYIQSLEEPTMIVFFGDHLPQITDQYGNSMVSTLPYFNTDDEKVNLYREYNTSALLLANFPIEESEIHYLSPDMLSTYVLNNMDLELSPYYRYLYTLLPTMGGMNKYVVQDSEGGLHYPTELEGKLKDAYLERESMQYRYFISDYQ
ncbi:MAG: sulfatase-like hydrolase/transferase [Spirochaetales bacterium]|nr:sulfatase-like hydrolase/transferase [Candidatus Physcosoma equi]